MSHEDFDKLWIEYRRFCSAILHDLRAPVRAMRGFVPLLREERSEFSDKAQLYLNVLEESADRMGTMLEGLDSMTKAMADRQLQTVSSELALQRAIDDLDSAIDKAHASVCHLEPLPEVQGDSEMLRRIFKELIDNALRHGGEEPRIEVGANVVGDTIEIWFEDNGPGIIEGREEQLFRPFLRGDPRSPAPGLGLTICRRLAEAMAGSVEFQADNQRGARFVLRLPSPDNDRFASSESLAEVLSD